MSDEVEPQLRYLLIIPDGNGRWAQKHGLPIWEGHTAGARRAILLANKLANSDIEVFTFWGMSTENWIRSPQEVQNLLAITQQAIKEEGSKLLEYGVRLRHAGRKDRLPPSLRDVLDVLKEQTMSYNRKTFVLALDYGGRDEIIRAIGKVGSNPVDEVANPSWDLIDDVLREEVGSRRFRPGNREVLQSYLRHRQGLLVNPDVYFTTQDKIPDEVFDQYGASQNKVLSLPYLHSQP